MLTGVLLGLAVGVFNILMYNYKLDYFLEKGTGSEYTLTLSEHMSFLNKASIINAFREISSESHLIIDGTRTEILDDDVLEVIRNFSIRAAAEKIQLEYRGFSEKHKQMIESEQPELSDHH
jgi:MFS superfamily sulfate permease-like transporter